MYPAPASRLLGYLQVSPQIRCNADLNLPARSLLFLLRQYKRWISPLLGKHCRFYPSCSDYARIAIHRFGAVRGCLLAGWRLLRCQPYCEGGDDPVPERFAFPRWRRVHDHHHH